MEKLNKIQLELKAAKDKKNNFGGFNYRNIEAIYTELKPILDKHNAHLKMTSDLIQLGNNAYIKVIATFVDMENNYEEQSTSFAAIDFEHKGMSNEQACGAAQTYAAKYAINHLFLLDDGSLDADAQEPKESSTQPKQKAYTESNSKYAHKDTIKAYFESNDKAREYYCKKYNKSEIKFFNLTEVEEVYEELIQHGKLTA